MVTAGGGVRIVENAGEGEHCKPRRMAVSDYHALVGAWDKGCVYNPRFDSWCDNGGGDGGGAAGDGK